METYDVVVVGGGPAGLAAATATARFRLRVLLLDGGAPRNAPAAAVHNVLGHDGRSALELDALGSAEVERFGGEVVATRVTALSRDDDGFVVTTDAGTVRARRLVVATGARDELPAITGLAARWGRDVVHCPFCHGYEVAGERVGVLATSPVAVHQALLFRQLTGRLTVLAHGWTPDHAALHQLGALGIEVVDGEVVEVLVEGDRLTGARLADGTEVRLDALVVGAPLHANAELLAPLGLSPVSVELGGVVVADRIEAGPGGTTSVPGLFVAGNVTDPQAQVVSSAAAGLAAGAAVVAQVVQERAAQAAADRLDPAEFTPAGWEARYAANPRHWSGAPNAALVDEVVDLAPGTALDVGAGEGGDAVWLASRGWRVTALDVSATALDRGRSAADDLAIDWRELDLASSRAPGTYDLVSAFYVHLPPAPRRALLANAAAAVAPGGVLLVVGHDFSDVAMPRHGLAEMGWNAAELGAELPAGFTVEVAETRPRTALHDGHEVDVRDAVLRARRTS